jgi:hypothetical protein
MSSTSSCIYDVHDTIAYTDSEWRTHRLTALADVLSQCNAGSLEQRLARKLAFVEELKTMPIAIETKTANEQHYEVRTRRFNLHIQPLGPDLCMYPEPLSNRRTTTLY